MPNTTNELPRAGNAKHTWAIEEALTLPAGSYVRIDLATTQEARSAKSSLYQSIRRYGFDLRALLRGTSVYVGRAK